MNAHSGEGHLHFADARLPRVDLAARLRALVAPRFSPGAAGYDPCHDIFHLDRVARNAAALAAATGADTGIVTAAAYIHDLDRAGETDPLAAARSHLQQAGASASETERILEVVERHKDKSFAPGGKRPRSLEASVLSDADKLEAIGAIGIARAFSYGGLKGRELWDGAPTFAPTRHDPGQDTPAPVPDHDIEGPKGSPLTAHNTRRAIQQHHPLIDALAAREANKPYISGANGTTIDHFFQKLLRLQPDFATPLGQQLAQQRHEHLRLFLTQFFNEWYATQGEATRDASQ